MEKEIEKILNKNFYLHIKVKFIEFGTYVIEIEEMKKNITYKFNFDGLSYEDNIEEIKNIIRQEIINYYEVE